MVEINHLTDYLIRGVGNSPLALLYSEIKPTQPNLTPLFVGAVIVWSVELWT